MLHNLLKPEVLSARPLVAAEWVGGEKLSPVCYIRLSLCFHTCTLTVDVDDSNNSIQTAT